MTSIISSVSSQITNNIFSKIDSKNQGYIEKSDLASALGKSDSENESLFNSIDTDNDGQITKSEMTTKIENLLGQLNSNSSSNRMPPPGGAMQSMGGMPPPPPPPSNEEDEGVTLEQASEIASTTDDEMLSSIMSEISENFEVADADGDGKVTREEGMAFHEENKKTSSTDSSNTDSIQANITNDGLQQLLAKLIEAYGIDTGEDSSSIYANA